MTTDNDTTDNSQSIWDPSSREKQPEIPQEQQPKLDENREKEGQSDIACPPPPPPALPDRSNSSLAIAVVGLLVIAVIAIGSALTYSIFQKSTVSTSETGSFWERTDHSGLKPDTNGFYSRDAHLSQVSPVTKEEVLADAIAMRGELHSQGYLKSGESVIEIVGTRARLLSDGRSIRVELYASQSQDPAAEILLEFSPLAERCDYLALRAYAVLLNAQFVGVSSTVGETQAVSLSRNMATWNGNEIKKLACIKRAGEVFELIFKAAPSLQTAAGEKTIELSFSVREELQQ